MSIIYSLIAKQPENEIVNLCSYDAAHGNYPNVINEILKSKKLTQSISYNYLQYKIHILVDGMLIFLAFADSNMKQNSAFQFLDDLKKKFRQRYTNEDVVVAKAYDMSSSFSQTYQHLVSICNNSNGEVDKKEVIKKQLANLQNIMSQNIDKVLQREEKVQLIVKKTGKIDSIADQIKKNASRIKKESFWRKHKCQILLGMLMVAGGGALFIFI